MKDNRPRLPRASSTSEKVKANNGFKENQTTFKVKNFNNLIRIEKNLIKKTKKGRKNLQAWTSFVNLPKPEAFAQNKCDKKRQENSSLCDTEKKHQELKVS